MAFGLSIPFSMQVLAQRVSGLAAPLYGVPALAQQAVTYTEGFPVARYKAIAELTAATARLKWTEDPWKGKLDWVKHPTFMQQAIEQHPDYAGDCLPAGTLLLNDLHELVPIENIAAGDRIWGLGRWSTVAAQWSKGVLPVDVVHLGNGGQFRATKDHKVYVALCRQHQSTPSGRPDCFCGPAERSIERLTVGQLEPGMVLLVPDRLPDGETTKTVDRPEPETLTSWRQVVSTRLAYRRQGRACRVQHVPDHSRPDGLACWRLYVEPAGPQPQLRVQAIDRAVDRQPVHDITTDDHYVYLPEADVTVSNCDDYAAYWCVALRKSNLADEAWLSIAMWANPAKKSIDGHAVAVFRTGDQWWHAGNWNKCEPISIPGPAGYVADFELRTKCRVVTASQYRASAAPNDTCLLDSVRIVRR